MVVVVRVRPDAQVIGIRNLVGREHGRRAEEGVADVRKGCDGRSSRGYLWIAIGGQSPVPKQSLTPALSRRGRRGEGARTHQGAPLVPLVSHVHSHGRRVKWFELCRNSRKELRQTSTWVTEVRYADWGCSWVVGETRAAYVLLENIRDVVVTGLHRPSRERGRVGRVATQARDPVRARTPTAEPSRADGR